MDLAHPYRLLSHPLDGAVISVLAGTSRPLTGREVARLAPEGSQPGVWKALGRLADAGLVNREEVGNALLYDLNRDHVAAPAALALAALRESLFSRASETIAAWEIQPAHASIFGSAARGDGDIDSDIDLLVVRPASIEDDDDRWRSQIYALSVGVERWTGNRASVSELAERDLPRLDLERPPVVEAITADGITLAGPDVTRLFRESRS